MTGVQTCALPISTKLKYVPSTGVLTSTTFTGNHTGNGSGLSSITGANVSGQVSYAAVANSVAGANVTGAVAYATTANSVAVANVVGIGNIATVNLTGSTSNVLYGNGVFAPITSTYGNSNVAAFLAAFGSNTITTTGNANIGNLNIVSNGDIVMSGAGSNIQGANIVSANFFSGDGSLLSNINASNISGTVSTTFQVKNTGGSTLAIGTPIYLTGTVGNTNVIQVAASRADTSSTMGCIGVLAQTLANNATGSAVSVGEIQNIDTSLLTVGQEVFVAPTGGYTTTRPTGANIVQPIGTVARVNASTGIINYNVWDIVRLPNLNSGNIWVGNTDNGNPVQAVLSTANVGNANFASYAGNVTVSSQPNITSVGTLTSLSVTGTVTGGNLVTSGQVSAAGNATFGNVTTNGVLSVTGNANIGNIGTAGLITATGNVTAGNLTKIGRAHV